MINRPAEVFCKDCKHLSTNGYYMCDHKYKKMEYCGHVFETDEEMAVCNKYNAGVVKNKDNMCEGWEPIPAIDWRGIGMVCLVVFAFIVLVVAVAYGK